MNVTIAALALIVGRFIPGVSSATHGSDSDGISNSNGGVAVLTTAEVDEFNKMVREDCNNRPRESIPVSEGGTSFCDVIGAGRSSPARDFARSNGDDVSCGGHRAPNCSLCPQGNGAAWCNGECTWNYDTGRCEPPPLKRCDDAGTVLRPTCAECETAQCTGTQDCERMPGTGLCRYVLEEDTRSASVHLVYMTPAGVREPAWWFQRLEILSSSDVSYFSTSGHSFGYAGFQQSTESPFQGRILFSIWDQGGCDRDVNDDCPDDQIARTVACGEGVQCTDFGGEGTGRKSIVYSNDLPVLNQPYYLVTHAKKVSPFRMQYSAYFYVPGDASWGSTPIDGTPYGATPPGWRFLSRIEVGTDAQERWRMRNMYSFVEQWSGVSGLARRAALFGPGFVAQDPGAVTPASFEQMRGAFFTYGKLENHKHVNAFQNNDESGIGLEIGGGVVREAAEYQVFNYPEAAPPPELVCFSEKSGCLSEATTAAGIEACLASSCGPATPGPTAAPMTPGPTVCEDDLGWRRAGNKVRTCDHVAQKPGKRCSWPGANGIQARDACREACGSCGVCVDDRDWRRAGNKVRTCDHVAQRPEKRCRWRDANGIRARDACKVTCGSCGPAAPGPAAAPSVGENAL